MTTSEDGFTLPELLICTIILGIVMAVLANAFFVMFRSVDTANTRSVESHDAQLASDYFTTDIQSADSIESASSTSTDCGGAGPLLRLRWQARDTNPPTNKVADYRVVTNGSERSLQRTYCEGTTTVTPISSVVIARSLLQTGGSSDPSVTCKDASGANVACTTTASVTVASVTLSATASAAQSSDQTQFRGLTQFTYVLTGVRRSNP